MQVSQNEWHIQKTQQKRFFSSHLCFFSATNKSGCKTTSTTSSRRDSDWTSVSTEDPGYGSMRSDNQVNGSRRCSELSSASQVGLCFFFQSLGFVLQKVTRVQIGYSPKKYTGAPIYAISTDTVPLKPCSMRIFKAICVAKLILE